MKKLTIPNLVKEICKRDNAKGTGYDLRDDHVSAVLKNLFDIFGEQYNEYRAGERRYAPYVFINERIEMHANKAKKPSRPASRKGGK